MKANLINLVIAGAGYESNLICKSIAHSVTNDIIVFSPQEATQIQLTNHVSEQFVLSNPYPIKKMTGDFICKGKHQYRHINTIKDERENETISKEVWSCQCGKVLGS